MNVNAPAAAGTQVVPAVCGLRCGYERTRHSQAGVQSWSGKTCPLASPWRLIQALTAYNEKEPQKLCGDNHEVGRGANGRGWLVGGPKRQGGPKNPHARSSGRQDVGEGRHQAPTRMARMPHAIGGQDDYGSWASPGTTMMPA